MTQRPAILRGFFSCQGRAWRLALAVLGLLATAPARAQDPPTSSPYRNRAIDSLRAVLRRSRAEPADTQRVLTLINLEQQYYENDDAEALRLGQQALALARRRGFARGELMALSALSRAASNAQQLPQAERWAQELQRRAAAAPPHLRRFRVEALQILANVAVQQRNNLLALGYLRQALALLPPLPAASEQAMLTYYGLSVGYTNRVLDVDHPADSLVRLARRYSYRFAGLARVLGRRDMQASAYIHLGMIANLGNRRDSTDFYLGRAVAISRALGSRQQEAYVRRVWAETEQNHGRYASAADQARQGIALARAVHNAESEYVSYDALADALAALGQGTAAYRAAKRGRQLHDSVAQVNNQAGLQSLQVRYDTEQKQHRIRQLTLRQQAQQAAAARQRQRLWGLSAGLALLSATLAVVVTLSLRLRRSRTQLALQNTQLAEARATQDQLYALIAHDLRSPVVAFAGLADLLNFYVHTNNTDRLAGLGGRIRQAAQHLSELLDNLLNWAVSQRGELAPHPRPVRAAELLADTTALYEAAAMAAGVHLSCTAAPDLLVQADPDMTRTILRNLVGNALKASPANGAVSLSAECVAGQVRLLVRDNGGGLSPALLAQLNQPGDAPLRVAETGHRGAGLGLRLSRRFAEAQGGSLVLQNAPQGGAQATLCLPLAS